MKSRIPSLRVYVCLIVVLLSEITVARAQDLLSRPQSAIFERENLVAWCIVPFDSKQRGPEDRAAMLQQLGIRNLAYDYRQKHVPTFDAEMDALKKRGIKLTAWWFPGVLNDEARHILDVLKRHDIQTQLWVAGGGGEIVATKEQQQERVKAEAKRIRPIAEAAAEIGCQVALYNHGGWFGEPENQIAIIKELNLPNVGIVYNLHHGHTHVSRFEKLLREMKPYLLALNLNGMIKGGDRTGNKILPIGAGELDLQLLTIIRDSGWEGPIGILNHTDHDAKMRLQDNLDGLGWLVSKLEGNNKRPRPKYRTHNPHRKNDNALNGGMIVKGKEEYRSPPITVDCRVRLTDSSNYNILVANDKKNSGAHWEIFTSHGTGRLTAYLPGMKPDHVASSTNIADGSWRHIAMIYEANRVTLFVDGQQVADQKVRSQNKPAVPGDLGIGRLVEGSLQCKGEIEYVRIRQGVHEVGKSILKPPTADDITLGLWKFDSSAKSKKVKDHSQLNDPAQFQGSAKATGISNIPPGPHISSPDKHLKAVLIDRSENEAYMAVKADTEGQLFVGGREGLFLFQPDSEGGYLPRRELFRFPPDSIIIGIELRGDDLYVLTSSALYLIPKGRTQRQDLQPKRLLWGVPLDLHVSFHCMAWGPEGDLYLNHGDPLLGLGPESLGHWTLHSQPEGTKTPYTGAGAVLRIRPDGTGLQVVARGLRGPVGLAFDPQWNLFTNDNDHESQADRYAPIRLLHVTPKIDFGWPHSWMASMSTDRADVIESMSTTLGRGVPCDLTYYDEPFLSVEHRGKLLMCRWARSTVAAYSVEPRGASFSVKEAVLLEGQDNARPTGIAVGRGGRLFVTSLYLTSNVVSPHCPSDLTMLTRVDDDPSHPFNSFVITEVPASKLWSDLSSNSWESRQQAHLELLRRGKSVYREATSRLLNTPQEGLAFTHLLWLAGASQQTEAIKQLVTLAGNSSAEVRWQALRALDEFHPQSPQALPLFEKALSDSDPRIQLLSLQHFFKTSGTLPLAEIVDLATSEETYLRQTAFRLLAQRASTQDLQQLAVRADSSHRLAGVLAIGERLTMPAVDDVPPDNLALSLKKENAFFKRTIHFADPPFQVDLSSQGRVGSYSMAERWQSTSRSPEQKILFSALLRSLGDESSSVRLQAAYFLSRLHDSRTDTLIEQVRQRSILEGLSETAHPVREAWMVGPLLNQDKNKSVQPVLPEQRAIDLTANYQTAQGLTSWKRQKGSAKGIPLPEGDPSTWNYLYFQLQSNKRQHTQLTIECTGNCIVWSNGQRQNRTVVPSENLPGGLILDLQPGSNDILIQLHARPQQTVASVSFRSAEGVVATMPEKLDSSLLADRLKEAAETNGGEGISSTFLNRDWSSEAREKGRVDLGRQLFSHLGCVKCHAIVEGQQGGGAPSLVGASKRFSVAHLVESILLPNKQIAGPFRNTMLETIGGKNISGLVVTESAESIELLQQDTSRLRILTEDIVERGFTDTSSMPTGLVKSPEELRDLLAYLLSDHPLPP